MVKICGLKTNDEIRWAKEAGTDLVGMVVFYEKSKRNIDIDTAARLIDFGPRGIKYVAVTVSPDEFEISQIEDAGFDYIQIHGKLSEELLEKINIPVIKAFNVNDMGEFEKFALSEKIAGFVFDANIPGSGLSFDYNLLNDLKLTAATDKFILLAGGLGPDNVEEALRVTGFKGADTSSGVEREDGMGKSREKIFAFVEAVKRGSR